MLLPWRLGTFGGGVDRQDPVKLGTMLFTKDLAFLGLLDCGYDVRNFSGALPQAQNILSALKGRFSAVACFIATQ